jgi:hypothetical protein
VLTDVHNCRRVHRSHLCRGHIMQREVQVSVRCHPQRMGREIGEENDHAGRLPAVPKPADGLRRERVGGDHQVNSTHPTPQSRVRTASQPPTQPLQDPGSGDRPVEAVVAARGDAQLPLVQKRQRSPDAQRQGGEIIAHLNAVAALL